MTSSWQSAVGSTLKWLSLATLLSGAALLPSPVWALDVHVTGLVHANYPTPSGNLEPEGGSITTFAYVVNEDNTADAFDSNTRMHPGVHPMASHSHVVAAGDQAHVTILGADGAPLPGVCPSPFDPPGAPQRPCKYFISVRAPGYKLWGQHFMVHPNGDVTIPHSAPTPPETVTTLEVALIKEPLPLAKLVVKVFEDFAPVNGFPDFPLEIGPESGPATTDMTGFQVIIEDIFGQVSVDFNGDPICGTGKCFTNAAGDLTIENLGFGKYDVHAIPPVNNPQQWVQTTTFEGTRGVDAWLEEGSDGLGAPREILAEPFVQTAHFFGFTRAMAAPGGPGTITGRVRNYVEFPPFAQLTLGQPVNRPWITLTDIGNTDTQILRARGNADGTFNITGVPYGTYQMAIWDDPLDYIMAFYTVVISPSATNVNMGDLGIFRWFAWLSGYVFFDNDCTIINGAPSPTDLDCGIKGPTDPGIKAFDVDIRARDATIPYATITDANGHYEYPEVISPLGKFLIGEVGFGRFGLTGQSVHNELCSNVGLNPGLGCPVANRTVVPGEFGGDLLTHQLLLESHRSIVDWGKRNYATNETGQIVGITFYDTTRNELDARLEAAEEYEPAIPGVLVRLWSLGADNKPNTADDALLNEYISDAWQHPSVNNGNGCDVLDKNGNPVPGATPQFVADNCIEVPQLGNETKDGAFDGGYAFAATCPLTTGPSGGPILAGPTIVAPTVRGQMGENVPTVAPSTPGTNPEDIDGDGIPNTYDTDPLLTDAQVESCATPLTPRDYVVQVVAPPFYQITAEEDINVDEGSSLVPAILPPPCVGDLHTVNDIGGDIVSPYNGTNRPLCDKRRVTLAIRQNANSDFFLFTDMDVDPWTKVWHTEVSVPPAGRFFGLIEDDLDINTDPNSITYGEKRPVEGAPVGVRDYTFRKLTTVYADEYGFYEVMVPSTFTAFCPIPNGVCPGMIVLTVNDPGDDPTKPDPFFRPSYLTEPAVFEVWPAHMTPTDTPIDPVETGAQCSPSVAFVDPVTGDSSIVPVPEIVQVSIPYGNSAGGFSIDVIGVDFGASTPTVTLGGTVLPVSYFPAAGNTFVDRATVQVPDGFPPGPHQLLLTNNDTHKTGANGMTIHVLGGSYTPNLVTVSSTIQAAIDSAPAGSLIIVPPGTYEENVILWKPVKLQGYGPGGVVGSPESELVPVPPGEDPFANYPGSVIDGRFFTFNQAIRDAWHTTLNGLSFGGPSTVAEGAAITVVAAPGAFGANPAFKPQIDGFGITAARGFAGGGIYVHAYGTNLQITNNIIDRNQSAHGGAVAIGRPVSEGGDPADNNNDGVGIIHNRMLRNGGVRFAGAVGIFNGAENYEIAYNDLCGNASSEYGGGISHFGLSNGGHIHDNRIYYNNAFDSGGGIQIAGDAVENPAAPTPNMLGLGSGNVTVEANLIQANLANDDGGGISLLRPLAYQVDIVNNIVANNVAADFGGGIFLDDASNITIVNNTVAANVSTETAEDADKTTCSPPAGSGFTCPHAAGLLSEANGQAFRDIGGPAFPNPVMFNNIFWQNEAFFYNPAGNPSEPPLNLVSAGFIDLEVFGTPGTLSPKYSILTSPYAGADGTNIIGADPLFVFQEETDPVATPNRLNPGEIILEYLRITHLTGDYHLQVGSPAIGQATIAIGSVNAPIDDFDGETRTIPYDIGADEFSAPGAPPPPVVALLLFSTAGDTAIPGVSGPYDNADIYKYDSAGNFSRVFDATAAGLPATANIDALYYVPPPLNTFYMSFSPTSTVVPNVGTVQDEDIVQYNANTGQWSMYFDGTNVGLGDASAEDVDAFTLLDNGDVIISTVGTASVLVGSVATSFPRQDLLRCSGGTRWPSATTCTWSQYLDGSDAGVGLSTTNENVDDVTVFGNNIVLSTIGPYAVPGLSNAAASAGSDVIVCRGATTGTASSCASYSKYFNGAALGITDNIDAFHSTQDPATIVVARAASSTSTSLKSKGRH